MGSPSLGRWTVLLLVLSVGIAMPTMAAGDSYYVSADAPDNGDGSRDRPFGSLQQAEAASRPGDSIYVLANNRGVVLDGGIALKPSQKLLGATADGRPVRDDADERVRLTNSTDALDGMIVRLANHNEIAGLHFVDMRSHAIAGIDVDYSGTHVHHVTFSGHADEHIEDERGLVYAISLDASAGNQRDIVIEDSGFYDGHDLGAIRVFHSGDSRGNYLFQRNDFSDLGGRPYYVQTRHHSFAETIILDSTADNIGLGDRNSDSIIPYLMGQSEQVMLIRNYHFKNTKQVGNQSNTGIEAYMFGSPRPDEANWCTGCTLTFKILDSLIENAVTDGIQFSNSGRNSRLTYEIRNTRIVGGTPRQGDGGISLNLGQGGGSTTLLVENTEVVGTTGYGFTLNRRGDGGDHGVVVDLGGGALGSGGGNRFADNERGDMRVAGERVSARHNEWDDGEPRVFNADDTPYPDAPVDYKD